MTSFLDSLIGGCLGSTVNCLDGVAAQEGSLFFATT